MTGYDTSDGYRIEPLDDRDEDDPEFTVDPILSGVENDGGDRPDRHRGLQPDGSYERRTPSEVAAFDDEERGLKA